MAIMAPDKNIILEARDIKTYFPMRRGLFQKLYGYKKAVDGVNFKIARGETLGVVGESGCGKSTLGKTIMRLIEPAGGSLMYHAPENGPGGVAKRLELA
jgi:ABC-type oligopeptide transport system ATPase subunit